MAGEGYAAMNEAGRLAWWPSRARRRTEEELAERRRQRAERARHNVKGATR